MIKQNQVHTLYGTHSPVNFGANYTVNFVLNVPNRTCLIKSIFYDLKLFNAATFELLPINRNSFIHSRLNVGTNAAERIGRIFEGITAGFAVYTGQGLTFFKPTFVLFDSFFVRNTLPCRFYVENQDAAINIAFEVSVIMEVEEIE